MPNHCSNYLKIVVSNGHEDYFDDLVKAIQEERLFEFITPVPECLKDVIAGGYGDSNEQAALEKRYAENIAECGYANWYQFCVAEWGTKWDLYGLDLTYDRDALWIDLHFNTAWAPPTKIYWAMESLEQIETFKAYYFEPGCSFCGVHTPEHEEEYTIEKFTVDWVYENIPEAIIEHTGMYEIVAECEEYDEG